MKTNLLISMGLLLGMGALLINAINADAFFIQVLFSGLAVALFFYHLNRRNTGFRLDANLAQKSLALGVVSAVPFAMVGLPLLAQTH